MEVYDENKTFGSKSRRSQSRRSSILKTAVLTDIDPNQQQHRSPRKRKTKRISSRRVSFADTYLVKEFPRDSPHRPAPESEEASPEVNFQSDLEVTDNLQTRQPEIKGLDQLLTGAIHHQTTDQDVKELPFPHNTSDNSLQSGVGYVNPNHTIVDTTDMDITCSSAFLPGELFNQPAPNDFGEQVDEPKIDASVFLQSWSKMPSGSIEDKKLFVPEKQFPDVSEPKFTTQINTSLNKYVGFCATASTSGSGSHRISLMSETDISATISTSKQRLPLGSISDSIAKPTTMSVLEETLNECSRSDLDDTKVDGKSFLSKIFGKFDGGNGDDKTIVFGDNEDMEETEVIFKGIGLGLEKDNQESKNDERYAKTIGNLTQTTNVLDDKTVVFNNNNDMEQTVALGNVCLPSGKSDFDNRVNINRSRENDTEKTQPWIDPSSQLTKATKSARSLFDELKNNLSERTRHFSDDMEFTECHDVKIAFKVDLQAPGVTFVEDNVQVKNDVITDISSADLKQTINNVDFQGNSEELNNQVAEKSVRKSLIQNLGEKTQIFGNDDITGGMEITSCIGGIEKSTQDAVDTDMELTSSVGTEKKSASVMTTADMKVSTNMASHLGVISSMGINHDKMKLGKSVLIDNVANSDKTKIYSDDVTCGMEMTSCVGGLENKTLDLFMRRQEKTKTFSNGDLTAGMEMTACVGELINANPENLKSAEKTKIYSNDDVTCGMEMTSCMGGFVNSKSDVSKSAEKTKIYSNDDVTCGMEMTSCMGGFVNSKSDVSKSAEKTNIYSKDDITYGMEMTSCVGGFMNSKLDVSKSAEKTKLYSNNDLTCGMEMTACVGGFMNSKSEIPKSGEKTKIYSNENVTVGMEMTSCVGEIEKKHPNSSDDVKTENIETMNLDANREKEKLQTVHFDIISPSLESTQHTSEKQATNALENTEADSDPNKKFEKFDVKKTTLNTNIPEMLSEDTKSALKLDEENLTLSSLSMLKSKLYSHKSTVLSDNGKTGAFEAEDNKEVLKSKEKDEKMECRDTELLKTTIGSLTEKTEGPCSGLKRKHYGIESLVKQRNKLRRVSEGSSIKSMKLQFDVTTSITAPIKLSPEEGMESKKVQQNQDTCNTTEINLDDKELLNLSNMGDQKDDIDIGITDIEPPLDLMGSTCTSHSDSSKSSCDIASETGLSYRNRTLNSTNSDPNQTLNSTRTREYSILAEMAEMAEKDLLKNSVQQSFNNDFEKDDSGVLPVEKFCHLIKMPKIKWTSMAKKPTRRSSILPPIRLEDMKGAIDAYAIFKTQVEVYGNQYNDACQHTQNNEAEVEEIEQRYTIEPPQSFKDVSSFSPEQCDQLRDKVKALLRSVNKIGKKAWKEIKFDAHTEYLSELKEKQEVICGEIKQINNAAKKAKELTSELQQCLEKADEEIAMLENLELPSSEEINEINTLTEALSKKEMELQTQEKVYSDSIKEKQNLEDKMRILEENERRSLIEESQEQELQIEQQKEVDKLQVELENIRGRLEPYSWDEEKEDCCMDGIDDILGLKQKLLCHYDKINSLVDWEIEDRDSNHIDILMMDETLMLHISKEPSNKDGTNKILSLKLKSMLIDDAPPLLKMLHKLLHDIIDTKSLLEKYRTESDLDKLLDEVTSIVCDVKVLYKEIQMLSLDFLVTITDQNLSWEIWSLKSLRKVIVEVKLIPHKTSYMIDFGVEVIHGNIRNSDVMNQLQQTPAGLQYITRLLNSVNLDLLTDKSVEES